MKRRSSSSSMGSRLRRSVIETTIFSGFCLSTIVRNSEIVPMTLTPSYSVTHRLVIQITDGGNPHLRLFLEFGDDVARDDVRADEQDALRAQSPENHTRVEGPPQRERRSAPGRSRQSSASGASSATDSGTSTAPATERRCRSPGTTAAPDGSRERTRNSLYKSWK